MLVSKGSDGEPATLAEIAAQTKIRVKVMQAEKKISMHGTPAAVDETKALLDTFFQSFVQCRVAVAPVEMPALSELGKREFPKLKKARHLAAAQLNKDQQVAYILSECTGQNSDQSKQKVLSRK